MMIRNLLVGLVPLLLTVLCVVFVPGTDAKVAAVWSFVMGAFQAAVTLPAFTAWMKSRAS
jgi:hypothetical protein